MSNIYLKEMDDFLKYLHGNKYSKSTMNSYYFGLNDFFNYLKQNSINPIQFTNQNIKNFKNSLLKNNSPQTINVKLAVIKKYVNYLKLSGNINMDWSIDIIKTARKRDIIPIKNINKLFNHIDETAKDKIVCARDKLLIKMLYYTGARTKELLKIKRNNILDNIIKFNNKNIILNNNLAKEISAYLDIIKAKENDYLFQTFTRAQKYKKSKSHITEKSAQDIFNKYKSIIDNDLSIIDLRNSYAINLKEKLRNTKFNKIYSHKTIKFDKDYLKLSTT